MFDNDLNYARSRIINTYMLPRDRKRKKMVLINSIHPGTDREEDYNDLSKAKITSREELDTVFKISDFEFTPGQLGYVDTLDQPCLYVTRMPLRRDWRQGLRAAQLAYLHRGTYKGVSTAWMASNIESITRTLRGDYLPVHEALEMVEETGAGKPLSRRFALRPDYGLEFQGRKVGRLNSKDQFQLDKGLDFLQQDLEKVVGSENVLK